MIARIQELIKNLEFEYDDKFDINPQDVINCMRDSGLDVDDSTDSEIVDCVFWVGQQGH